MLWSRICERLKREPTRVKYNEVRFVSSAHTNTPLMSQLHCPHCIRVVGSEAVIHVFVIPSHRRRALGQDKREWMNTTVDFYEKFTWDMVRLLACAAAWI